MDRAEADRAEREAAQVHLGGIELVGDDHVLGGGRRRVDVLEGDGVRQGAVALDEPLGAGADRPDLLVGIPRGDRPGCPWWPFHRPALDLPGAPPPPGGSSHRFCRSPPSVPSDPAATRCRKPPPPAALRPPWIKASTPCSICCTVSVRGARAGGDPCGNGPEALITERISIRGPPEFARQIELLLSAGLLGVLDQAADALEEARGAVPSCRRRARDFPCYRTWGRRRVPQHRSRARGHRPA